MPEAAVPVADAPDTRAPEPGIVTGAPKKSIADQIAANLQAKPPVQAPPAADAAAQRETPPSAAAPEVPAAPKTIAELTREAGFADVKDDDDAIQRIFQTLQDRERKIQEAEARARQFEELARYREQVAVQQPPQSAPAAAAQAATDTWWNPPAVDQTAVDFYRNDDGTWKPEAPLEIRQQVQRYDAYHKAWAEKIIRDPKAALRPMLEEQKRELRAELTAEWQQQQATLAREYEEATAYNAFIAKHGEWMFVRDPKTREPLKDQNGHDLLSHRGARFKSHIESLNPNLPVSEALAKALEYLGFEESQQQLSQQAANQQFAQVNEQKKQELLQRAIPGASSGGTFTQPGEPPRSQNKNLSPGEKLRAQLQRDGLPV